MDSKSEFSSTVRFVSTHRSAHFLRAARFQYSTLWQGITSKRYSYKMDNSVSNKLVEQVFSGKKRDNIIQIFHCSFNETSHTDANFLKHDVIIFDFGLFHELIQVTNCKQLFLILRQSLIERQKNWAKQRFGQIEPRILSAFWAIGKQE